jgi:hypothetical protein
VVFCKESVKKRIINNICNFLALWALGIVKNLSLINPILHGFLAHSVAVQLLDNKYKNKTGLNPLSRITHVSD